MKVPPSRSILISAIFGGGLLLGGGAIHAEEMMFHPIDVPAGYTAVMPMGASADGSTVVGYSRAVAGGKQAFRWTRKNGANSFQNLGFLPGVNGGNTAKSRALAANEDGRVVVGYGINASNEPVAFRWEAGTNGGADVMLDLGVLPGGSHSYAYGVNADGNVVVGYGLNAAGDPEAFRWTPGGMVGLGHVPGSKASYATAVSADGSTIAGYGIRADGRREAFRWVMTGSGGGAMTPLGILPKGTSSEATAISADGQVVTGYCVEVTGSDALGATVGSEAFRWTPGTGLVGLGDLGGGGINSTARALSAEGGVVVGHGDNPLPGGVLASVWTAARGMFSLSTFVRDAGINLINWRLNEASAIATKGRTIAGFGEHNGQSAAWVLTGAEEIAPPGVPRPSAQLVIVPAKKKITTAKTAATIRGVVSGNVDSLTASLGKKPVKISGTATWQVKLKNLKRGKTLLTLSAVGHGDSGQILHASVKVTIVRK